MKFKQTLALLVIVTCMVIYGISAVERKSKAEFAVSLDLAKPVSIEWPCEVSIVNDKGEKGLRIPPNVGRGWRDEAGGKAEYRFFIPEKGRYQIWAYGLWFDECSNAVFAQIDEKEKAIVGNDPVYGQWHWVRGFDVELAKGTHSLILSNHSDHIAIRKFVFTNSPAPPEETGVIFSDIFYDGFDGCDQGNFNSWNQVSGSWQVKTPEKNCLVENALIGSSNDRAFITYENNEWQYYCLDISVRVLPGEMEHCAFDVCFGVVDKESYYKLRIKPRPDGKAKVSVMNKEGEILSEYETHFRIDEWQQIRIDLREGFLEITWSDGDAVSVETKEKVIGGIGLMLEGKMKVYFDNIHVRKTSHNKEQVR